MAAAVALFVGATLVAIPAQSASGERSRDRLRTERATEAPQLVELQSLQSSLAVSLRGDTLVPVRGIDTDPALFIAHFQLEKIAVLLGQLKYAGDDVRIDTILEGLAVRGMVSDSALAQTREQLSSYKLSGPRGEMQDMQSAIGTALFGSERTELRQSVSERLTKLAVDGNTLAVDDLLAGLKARSMVSDVAIALARAEIGTHVVSTLSAQ
jgi:hypothetical protein